MRRKHLPTIAVLMVLAFALGCASMSYQAGAYNTLLVAANGYEAGMSSLRDLHEQGFVTDEQLAEIKPVAEKYWAAYHGAVEALEGYTEVAMVPVEGKEQLKKALEELAEFCGDLMAIINPILTKHGKESMKHIMP